MGVPSYYSEAAATFASQYASVEFRDVHPGVFARLSNSRSLSILDVGAGSGRDAAAMAKLGHQVTAVEPAAELWKAGGELADLSAVTHINDSLPALSQVPGTYDFILLSAVWQHLAPGERPQAMERLLKLLSPDGELYILLRLGGENPERGMHSVSVAELERLLANSSYNLTASPISDDKLRRAGVKWQSVRISSA